MADAGYEVTATGLTDEQVAAVPEEAASFGGQAGRYVC
jgi:hypothetical protein